MPVRVLIVDDQEPFRMAARLGVEGTEGFDVVRGAGTGTAFDVERPADRVDAIGHPLQARPARYCRWVESNAVVANSEDELVAVATELYVDLRRRCVLRHVVQCLEDTEIDRGLDVLGVSADAVRADADRYARPSRLRLQRRSQALILQQRRGDAPPPIPGRIERHPRLFLVLGGEPVRPPPLPIDQR